MEQFQYYQEQACVTLSRRARQEGAEVEMMRYGSWNTTGSSWKMVGPPVTVSPWCSESFGDSEPFGGSESFGDCVIIVHFLIHRSS